MQWKERQDWQKCIPIETQTQISTLTLAASWLSPGSQHPHLSSLRARARPRVWWEASWGSLGRVQGITKPMDSCVSGSSGQEEEGMKDGINTLARTGQHSALYPTQSLTV